MWAKFKAWLKPPIFGDEDKTRVAAMINGALLIILAATVLGTIVMTFVEPEEVVFDLFFGVILVAVILGLRTFLHRGYVRVIGWLLEVVLWISMTYLIITSGGIRSRVITSYFLIIVLAGVLLGLRATIIFGIWNTLTGIGLFYAETSGLITGIVVIPPTSADLVMYVTAMILATLLLQLSRRNMDRWMLRTGKSERELSQANSELLASRQKLEAYTQAVERRSAFLMATARITREVATLTESQALLSRFATLIGNALEVYHVGFFLLDRRREWGILRAASSNIGQRLVAGGYRLSLSQVPVLGDIVWRGEPHLYSDSALDATSLDKTNFPETRTAAILPLRQVRGGEVFGIIDIQSRQSTLFDEQDLIVLQSMADQVAMVLSLEQLVEELQSNLSAAERSSGETGRESWRQWLQKNVNRGYRFDESGVFAVDDSQSYTSTEGQGEGDILPEMAVPLSIRGQTLGKLIAHKPQGQAAWTQQEESMLQTLAEQLERALESARLYEVTQQRAVLEQATREITDNIRAAVSIEDAVRRAVYELARVLDASELVTRIGTERLLISGREGKTYD